MLSRAGAPTDPALFGPLAAKAAIAHGKLFAHSHGLLIGVISTLHNVNLPPRKTKAYWMSPHMITSFFGVFQINEKEWS
jgi:hypothetical protein